jgi:hypothetical protein
MITVEGNNTECLHDSYRVSISFVTWTMLRMLLLYSIDSYGTIVPDQQSMRQKPYIIIQLHDLRN